MAVLLPPAPPAKAVLPPLESDDFVECYRVQYPRLVRALRLAGAPVPVAEDLAQEAFARALSRWRRIAGGPSPAGYVYRTVFRLLSRWFRRRQDAELVEPCGSVEPGPDALVTSRVAVERRLGAMPPRRRACAVMCLVLGFTVKDASEALQIAEGTVRKHLEDARSDLRELL
jgi:RNA polymerase sigma-70 factor (ECF subfamily)